MLLLLLMTDEAPEMAGAHRHRSTATFAGEVSTVVCFRSVDKYFFLCERHLCSPDEPPPLLSLVSRDSNPAIPVLHFFLIGALAEAPCCKALLVAFRLQIFWCLVSAECRRRREREAAGGADKFLVVAAHSSQVPESVALPIVWHL